MNISRFIHVAESSVLTKAATLPVAYLADCRAAAVIDPISGNWAFPPAEFFRIRRKYRGYAISEVDRYEETRIISGCCDRADQY